MANNGHAAAQMLTFEPPSTRNKPQDEPGIETALGEAVASAVCGIAAAVQGTLQSGALPPAVKDISASKIAAVAQMQLDHELGDDDFTHKAREAGKRALRRYLTDDFFQRHSRAEADAALDTHIDDLFLIVGRVVKSERVYRVAWAN